MTNAGPQNTSNASMLRSVDCLSLIEQRLPALLGASRRVGDAIVRDPWAILGMTIYDVAEVSGVSLPSVTRFCRAVGYPGFRELVQGLAQSLGRIDARDISDLETGMDDTGLRGISSRIISRQIEALQDMQKSLDIDAVEQAVEIIAAARFVWILGHGSAHVSAVATAIKFSWAGVRASHSAPDIFTNQIISVGPGDVVLSISHQGRTRDVVELQQLARSQGATTIAISMVPHSPLAEASDLSLVVLSPEITRSGTRLVSYNAVLAVADILAAGLTEKLWHGNPPPHRDKVIDWMEISLRVRPTMPESATRKRKPLKKETDIAE